MKAICVDDERFAMLDLMTILEKNGEIESVEGFSKPQEALSYIETHPVDVAFLDIDMPVMNGILLAKKIKEISKRIGIIFTTGYSEYALDAVRMHANGYLLKPVKEEDIAEELRYLMEETNAVTKGVQVKTFGNFEVFVNDTPVIFHRSKSKEILAYLVDKQGTPVTRKEVAAVVLGRDDYERQTQAVLNTYLSTMKNDLAEAGIEDMFVMKNGEFAVNPSAFRCDMYDFIAGDARAVNSYFGEYMYSYEWAEFKNAYFESRAGTAKDEENNDQAS